MKSNRLAGAACVLSLAAVPAFAADLTIVFKTTGAGGPGTATSYFSSEKMRVGDAERETIVEYGPGRIVSIDHKKKEYSEVTMAELEAAMKAAADRMQQMNAQMASMPPAVRERMQGMMGGGAVTVTKGATRKVAGYDCQDYDVVMGGMLDMHLCATTAITPPAPTTGDFSRFKGFAGSATALAMNPMFKGVMDEMRKVQGFTIAESTSMKMMGHTTDTSKEATEIKTGPIPAEAFDVAAITKGYKKVASPATKIK
jgi:cell pole-organizing protein PopZ